MFHLFVIGTIGVHGFQFTLTTPCNVVCSKLLRCNEIMFVYVFVQSCDLKDAGPRTS